jgi:hypothetical protein
LIGEEEKGERETNEGKQKSGRREKGDRERVIAVVGVRWGLKVLEAGSGKQEWWRSSSG